MLKRYQEDGYCLNCLVGFLHLYIMERLLIINLWFIFYKYVVSGFFGLAPSGVRAPFTSRMLKSAMLHHH